MYLFSEIYPLNLLCLLLIWGVGGWLIASRLFNLSPEERGLAGLALGVLLATWTANWLGRWLPTQFAFWASALLILLIGTLLAWPVRREICSPGSIRPWQWLSFLLIFFLFTLIGRGLGLLDDHQNLPHVASMALGDIPPRLAYDPDLRFGYHYFMLLLASQFVQTLNAAPWVALDLARGLSFSLTFMLAGLLAYRLTQSRVAQALSMLFVAFAGGARWILLLLPASLLNQISTSVQLIGSGADSGVNLRAALLNDWSVEGAPERAFPFLYGSGLDHSISMLHNGFGVSAVLIIVLLLLLAQKRVNWQANVPIAVLLASLALANEVTFGFLYVGFVLTGLVWVIQNKTWRLPREFLLWLVVLIAGGVLSLIQGGMLTEIAHGQIERLFIGSANTYFRVSFAITPPTVLSAHLGYLSLLNPLHWLPIFAETGLALLALPWMIGEARKRYGQADWLTTAWLASIVPSLLMVFFEYTGNAGPTAVSRMMAHFLLVIKLMAVPVLWSWLQTRTDEWKAVAIAWGAATVFGGIMLFGSQITAMPRPIPAIYLADLDVQMNRRFWGQLNTESMVFDNNYPRAATLFGLPIKSSKTMGETLPEYNAFHGNPNPIALSSAGYGYIYTDMKYWQLHQELFDQACVRLLGEVEQISNDGRLLDFRRLVDISACKE